MVFNRFSLLKSIEELQLKRSHYQEQIHEIDKQIQKLGYYIEMHKEIEEHEA